VAKASPDRSSIAVLPFVDLSTRGDQEYLAEGVAAELIHALSGQPELRVVARTSSFSFKGRETDVREIAAQLGVGTVLEGSVRREAGKLRVTVQLIDAVDGFHLWSESYDRPARDLFAIQEKIAESLARELSREAGARDSGPPADVYEPDPRAYDVYLMGRAEANLRTPESSERALEHLERTIEIDPDYAAAHAELALVHLIRIEFAGQEAWQAAEQAAARAVELDPSLPEVLTALAHLRQAEFDWAGAEVLFRSVVELNPGWATGWEKYAGFLGYVGRIQEAVPVILRALELDPLSPLLQRQVGRYLYYAGETDRAIPHLLRSLELNPGEEYAASLLWMAYEQKGMAAEAREALMLIAPGWTRPPLRVAGRLVGTAAVLRVGLPIGRWLSPPCTVRPTSAALLYAYVGNADRVFECLDYILDHKGDFSYVKAHPFYDPYRADPRFVQVLRRAGLE
jgi:TolB-like protein/Tfp pilus assembly protein PilF